jgi:hypothetical protein
MIKMTENDRTNHYQNDIFYHFDNGLFAIVPGKEDGKG